MRGKKLCDTVQIVHAMLYIIIICRYHLLITGSIDASIKIWRLKNDKSLLLSSSIPITEIFEHDNAITCLSLYTSNTNSNSFLATGAEDGLLSVFQASALMKHVYAAASGGGNKDTILPLACQPSVVFSCQISQNRSPISGIAWYPPTQDAVSTVGFSSEKLVCCTQDGYLVCLDAQGKNGYNGR